MYQVRIKEFEKRNWKIKEEFETEKAAMKYAIKLDMEWRKSIDTMYNHIEVKYPDGTRFTIA